MKRQISIEKGLYIAVSICVLIYVALRAYYVPFTADEAGSFITVDMLDVKLQDKITDGDHTYVTFDLTGFSSIRSANTHYLNSLLMKVCSLLFGNSEFSLRLPNVVCLFFYLLFGYKLLKYVDNRYVRVCGFLLFSLNPFVLDFFGLARGYGLATSFAVISLYYFVAFVSGKGKTLFYAYLFAMLSAYANFITFNFYVAILSLNLIHVVWQSGFKIPVLTAMMKKNKGIISFNAVFLVITVPFLLLQTSTNQFYIGSNSLYNVFYSLSAISLYEQSGIDIIVHLLAVLSICISVLLIVLYAVRMFRAKMITPEDIPFLVISISFLLCILQNILLKLPLPERRTGIYLVPLFIIAVLFSYSHIGPMLQRYFKPVIMTMTLLFVVNFANSMNLRYAVYSVFDANARKVYRYLKAEAEKKEGVTRVNAHWFLTGAMYYYYVIDGRNEKLDIITVWPGDFLSQDTNICYYYFFDTGKILMPANSNELLHFNQEVSSLRQKVGCN